MADGLEFAVLGPVMVRRDGSPLPLDAQQRALLAALLVAFPHSVDIERLRAQVRHTGVAAESDGQGDGGPDPLVQALDDLRRRLEAGGADGERVIVRDSTRVQLLVDRYAVDSERFVDAVRHGDTVLGTAPSAAADAYREGLRLWQGIAYAGIPTSAFAETVFIEAEVLRLTTLRFGARMSLATAQLDSGAPAAAAVEAETLVADHPLDERAWELLVLGLCKSGQRAHALAALRRCRAIVDDHLGCEIGPALRRIETAIMTNDAVYIESARVPVPGTHRSNMLSPRTRLIDRERDVSEVMELLDSGRLVTLVGPGGVGRTRLAVEVSRRRGDPDGPWVVDLSKVNDGALIPSTIATLLALPGIGSAAHLADALSARACVLVLDNCEHVADYAADVARAIVTHCPDVRVIVTGADPLGVQGEAVHVVTALPVDEAAVELFSERAGGLTAGWDVNPRNAEAVHAICRAVEGLPLALEIAAAQLRWMTEEQIVARISAHFALLHGTPEPAIGPRGRLWDTIDWVNRMLSDGEARLLRRISVFAGSFDAQGATAVCALGSTDQVSGVLTILVRRGLLRVVAGSAPTRYRMLATVRRFAREQADDAESIAIRAAHRAYVLARVEAVARMLRSARAGQAADLLAADQAEHRAALESAFAVDDAHYALELSGLLAWFWYRVGNVGEGLQFLRAALDLVAGDWRPPEPRVMARALDGLASLTYLTGDASTAEDSVRRGAQLWSSIGETGEVARDEAWRSHFVAMQGRPEVAVDICRHAVQLAVEHDALWAEAEGRMVLGMLLRSVGEVEEARDELREAIRVGERCGHRWAVTSSTWALMKAAADAGDVEGSLAAMRVMRADLEEEGDVTSWLVMIHSTAAVLAASGRPTDAAVLMGAVDALGAHAGFLPAWIDAVDGPIEADIVHQALDDDEYEQYAALGAHLNRDEVNRLVGELVEGPVSESR